MRFFLSRISPCFTLGAQVIAKAFASQTRRLYLYKRVNNELGQ